MVVRVADESHIDRFRRQLRGVVLAQQRFNVAKTLFTAGHFDVIQKLLSDIDRDDSTFGAKIAKQTSRVNKPVPAPISATTSVGFSLMASQNFFSLRKDFAAFDFETFCKGFGVRIAKCVVDSRA